LYYFSCFVVFSNLSTPITNAQYVADKNEAIGTSTYYSIKTQRIALNEQEALKKNPDITQQELIEVNKFLNALSAEEIDEIVLDNGYDVETLKVDPDLGHASAITWVAVVIVGILVVGALIFTALYFNHKQKMNFINKCYANKGYPKVDSRDKGGIKGTTNSGSASAAGGYKMECRKR
jgi:hypothetical protein